MVNSSFAKAAPLLAHAGQLLLAGHERKSQLVQFPLSAHSGWSFAPSTVNLSNSERTSGQAADSLAVLIEHIDLRHEQATPRRTHSTGWPSGVRMITSNGVSRL